MKSTTLIPAAVPRRGVVLHDSSTMPERIPAVSIDRYDRRTGRTGLQVTHSEGKWDADETSTLSYFGRAGLERLEPAARPFLFRINFNRAYAQE